MKFHFRFQSLLDLKKKNRDEVGDAVGQANEAVRKIDTQIGELLQQIEASRAEQANRRVGRLLVDSMLTTSRYDLQLHAEHQSLLQTKQSLLEEVQRRQGLLALAEMEVKKFERIREQDRETYAKELLKREQEEIDDRIAARYIMNQRKSSKTTYPDA